jgi:hypothetical protein
MPLPDFFQEIRALYQDTDRKFQDTDRKFQDTDRKFQDTDRQFKETDRKIAEVSRQLGQLGNRLGEFVQEMVRPAVVRLFRERGIDVHMVCPNVSAERDGDAIEIDLFVVDDSVAMAVECKSRLSIDDVAEHIERLTKIKRLIPKYSDMRIMGAVAGMVVPAEVARHAYQKGLFVLAQNGSAVEIRNDTSFKPTEW